MAKKRGEKGKHNDAKARRSEVANLYLKGWFQTDIAAKFGVSQQQISNDLKVIYRMWRMSAIRDFDELKDRELLKIDKLELTYWNAWEESKQVHEKERKKYENAKLREMSKEKITPYGDARFLTGIQWCITKRCDILGINAPKEFKNTTPMTDQDRDVFWKEMAKSKDV